MEQYLDALEDALRQTAQRQSRPPQAARPRRRGRGLGVVAVLACACAALYVLLISGGDRPAAAQVLPVLEITKADASAERPRLGALARAGMDFTAARPISTPTGTGYVMTDEQESTVCLAVPDPPAGYGQSCAAMSTVRREGLVAQLVAAADTSRPSSLTIVLPVGARAPVAHLAGGRNARLETRDGIATLSVTADATVTYPTSDGRLRQLNARAREPQGKWYLDCGAGRLVVVPSARAASQREKYCGP